MDPYGPLTERSTNGRTPLHCAAEEGPCTQGLHIMSCCLSILMEFVGLGPGDSFMTFGIRVFDAADPHFSHQNECR
jgi:hypothetical protein